MPSHEDPARTTTHRDNVREEHVILATKKAARMRALLVGVDASVTVPCPSRGSTARVFMGTASPLPFLGHSNALLARMDGDDWTSCMPACLPARVLPALIGQNTNHPGRSPGCNDQHDLFHAPPFADDRAQINYHPHLLTERPPPRPTLHTISHLSGEEASQRGTG